MIDYMSKITLCLLTAAAVFASQIISGSASIPLSGPITPEQNLQGKTAARAVFKKNVLSWLSEQQGITVDSSNALDNFGIEQFLDSCMRFTKEETAFQGKIVTITLLLSYEAALDALQNHNNAIDSKASESWKKFKTAQSSNDFRTCYIEGLFTIAASNAHFGPPLIIPESDGKPLADVAKAALQPLVDKLRVTSSDMIIDGKPGHLIAQPPSLSIVMDSTPVSGIWLTAKLQNGFELFSKTSDETGKIRFSDLRIPFVTNGTLLYVNIDPGRLIGAPTYISMKNFGLKLRNSQEQTFIIKINRPIYKIDFKAYSAGLIVMPPDFANDTYVKKYLRDSCYMQEITTESSPDLEITVHSQVTDYNYDETEEVGIKTSIHVSIKGLTYNPPLSSENISVFEKRYERSIKVPYGLYFWETNTKIRELIKATVNQL